MAPPIVEMMVLDIMIHAVWFILPAWMGNMLACTFGGGNPIDGGKNFSDGRRLLGKGKTIRGLLVGIVSAVIVALIQWVIWTPYEFNPLIFGLLMGCGAMMGDLVKSFIKRRINISSGRPFPPFDQIDFICGAIALYYIAGPYILNRYYPLTWEMVIILLVLTPIAHLSTNAIGYTLGMKNVWW
jgi:CDP-2,3-bis-(O-geranylgeranyl)-sn-glycerol synthase